MDYFIDQGWIISLSALALYLFNELEDACVRNRWPSDRTWLNAADSWRNKWKMPLTPTAGRWWQPKYEERFWLSSTVLVWLTDGEHFFQFLKFRSVEIAIFVLGGWFALSAYVIGAIGARVFKELFIKQLD